MPSYGLSTVLAPIQVRIRTVEQNTQNMTFFCGLNFVLILFFVDKTISIKIDATSAITPPSFDGMDRRMTYANRKYHSGWMCTGVTSGFAGLKFSTSPSKFGEFDTISMNMIEISVPGNRSFTENDGWNFILSVSVFVLFGFEDPFSCSSIRWIIIRIISTIGSRKWREKNRFRVGWDTEGPPQIHTTRSFPTSGIADRTPVITVAPQNDICPHGRT